ncbi:hypothetical protein [Methanolobus sp.]|jgi:polyhydroxyalkanoate synthesis regulator phasin|uniref:hypothetical protein n=1 Tax=Methanolobus sp. TaxID=1874737 RepID=UPI0025F1B229|nr:hypothetical protein [Methanolobus sp.]
MDKMKKIGLLGAAALIGAGLAALSEERVREFVKEKVDTGKLSKEEGKILVEDIISETKRQKLDLEKNIIGKLQNSVQMADQELAQLSDKINDSKIEELEAELARMKSLRKANQ